MKKPTIDEYIQALEKMKRCPRDRVGILAELGVTGIGITAGAALSGTIAGAAGAATLAGSTTLASILGGVFVTTTPVGWVIGAAAAGGALACAASKLVRSGGKCDTLKKLSIEELERRIQLLRHEAKSASSHDEKMAKIITGIQYLVVNYFITQDKSTELLAEIEKGHISIEDAFDLVDDLISQFTSSNNKK